MDARDVERALERIRSESNATYSTIYLNEKRVREHYPQVVSEVRQFTATSSTAKKLGGRLLGVLGEGSRSAATTAPTELEPSRMAVLLEWAADAAGRVVDLPEGDFRQRGAFVRDSDRDGESVILYGLEEYASHGRVSDEAVDVIRGESAKMERRLRAVSEGTAAPRTFAWVHATPTLTFAAIASVSKVDRGEFEHFRAGASVTFLGKYDGQEGDVIFLVPIWLRRDY